MGTGGSTPATMPSDLPGFPGASHIYHASATGFFLDYSAPLKLTADQQDALKRIMEESMGDRAAAQRRIDQAEQELWMLTDSDRPDSMTLEMKVRDIEKLKGDQRIAFIRSVGEAVRVFTDDQCAALRGARGPAAAQDHRSRWFGWLHDPARMNVLDRSPKGRDGRNGDDSKGNMGSGITSYTKSNGAMEDM